MILSPYINCVTSVIPPLGPVLSFRIRIELPLISCPAITIYHPITPTHSSPYHYLLSLSLLYICLYLYLYLSLSLSLSLSISFYLSLSLCLFLYLSQPIRGKAEANRGRHGLEGGGADVDKITSSKQSRSKLSLISVFYLAYDTETESWLRI